MGFVPESHSGRAAACGLPRRSRRRRVSLTGGWIGHTMCGTLWLDQESDGRLDWPHKVLMHAWISFARVQWVMGASFFVLAKRKIGSEDPGLRSTPVMCDGWGCCVEVNAQRAHGNIHCTKSSNPFNLLTCEVVRRCEARAWYLHQRSRWVKCSEARWHHVSRGQATK